MSKALINPLQLIIHLHAAIPHLCAAWSLPGHCWGSVVQGAELGLSTRAPGVAGGLWHDGEELFLQH